MTYEIPGLLLDFASLESLIGLLMEKEAAKRKIKERQFGEVVVEEEEARRLLKRVAECTSDVLPFDVDSNSLPKLIVTHQLDELPRQTLKAYLFFVPLTAILFLLGIDESLRAARFYLLIAASFTLLVIPLLLHRRTRIHLEHQCGYGRDNMGAPLIVMEQLPSIRFQSYLAHEYAHHIYTLEKGETDENWIREGWARLAQWKVAQRLSEQEGNSAYLYHVLEQITGELKYACQVIAAALGVGLPGKVRWMWTIYHTNPFYTLATGTPISMGPSLLNHALGTAAYFLAAKKRGLKEAFRMSPESLF